MNSNSERIPRPLQADCGVSERNLKIVAFLTLEDSLQLVGARRKSRTSGAAGRFKYASKLTDPALGTYRLKISDYRDISDIEGEEIAVLRVGHRKDIYRKL